jgi:hypothetical protein
MEIMYYVIASIDIYKQEDSRTKISDVKPALFRLLDVTEDEANDDMIKEHRKYCGLINANELLKMLRDFDSVDTCKTMGSITEHGWLSAIAWNVNGNYSGDYSINIYVSPMPVPTVAEKAIFDSLSEAEKEIKRRSLGVYIDKTLGTLENVNDADVDIYDEDFHFPNEVEFHPEQVEIIFA